MNFTPTKRLAAARWSIRAHVTGPRRPRSPDHRDHSGLRIQRARVFEYADGSYLIADYKTARFTDAQNKKLMPRYKVQLNAYARIAADCGLAPISHLALIYLEPATKGDAVNYCGNCHEDGFVMGFQARVVEIPFGDGLLKDAMARTREIFDLSDAPDGAPGCEDCILVLDLAETLWPGISDVDLAEKLQRMPVEHQHIRPDWL